MALDFSAGYDVFTVPNPTGTVTDFPFLVRLTRARNGDLFDACTEQNALKLRVSKGDGTTELAFDPFYEDWTASAEEIIFACLWSGSLTTSGSYELRVTPALSTNTAYGVNDTYGRYNAWPSDSVDIKPDGTTSDRSSNQNNATRYGSLADITGKLGVGTASPGTSSDYARVTDDSSQDLTTAFTYIVWLNPDDITSRASFCQKYNTDNNRSYMFELESASYLQVALAEDGINGQYDYFNNPLSLSTWAMLAFTWTAGNHANLSVNGGAKSGPDQTSGDTSTISSLYSGAAPLDYLRSTYSTSRAFDGRNNLSLLLNSDWGIDKINYFYSQSNDNSTFWGTPTWVSGGGGTTVTGTDTVSLPDTASVAIGLSLTASDSLSMADTESINIGLSITGADSLTLLDTSTATILLTLTATDNTAFTDTGSTSISILVSGLDSIGLGDFGSSGGSIPIAGADVLYLADSASVQIAIDVSGSDNVGLGDIGTGGDIAIGTGSDTLILSDTASVDISVSVNGSDSISLSEIESIIHGLDLSGSDALSLSDVAQSSGVIAGILRLAISALSSRTIITAEESHTIVTVRKI